MTIVEAHHSVLACRGVPLEYAETMGVRSVLDAADLPEEAPSYWSDWLPALIIPWRGADGRTEYQIRPDSPPSDASGRMIKYATRSSEDGYEPVLWLAKTGSEDGPRMLIEGTCQTLAVSACAPADAWVYGMVGCRGWMSGGRPMVDLSRFTDTDVIVALDADVETNLEVWRSGELLQRALKGEGASSIKWLKLPASRKTGIDDLLGARAEGGRAAYLARLIAQAVLEKFPKSRSPKRVVEVSPFFGDDGLKTKTLAEAILDRYPALLTAEGQVAVYRDGFYGIDADAFASVVAELLGERFRREYLSTVQAYVAATLYAKGAKLPERMTEPMINFVNGMLDLRTGDLVPHDPSFLSTIRIPWVYDPDAQCPTYERWIKEVAPGQVEDLEESASMMLDPSIAPTKALFLFGVSRSGKSTFLRLMRAVASSRYTSSVTLHQLADNRFAAANVYGMVLNVAADLSNADIEDVSVFKLMTGDDAITADRKHGRQFSFVNSALFAFSANELPTVGERSKAYLERMRPFSFPNSFAGAEDPAIEAQIVREIPGVIARWVRAYRDYLERGRRVDSSIEVSERFARESDRVRMFIHDACHITDAHEGAALPADQMSTASQIAEAFDRWAREVGGRSMGRNKLMGRLMDVPGVRAVRGENRTRGVNLVPAKAGQFWSPELPKNCPEEPSKLPGDTPETARDLGAKGDVQDVRIQKLPGGQFRGQFLGSSGDPVSAGEDVSRAVRAVSTNKIDDLTKRRVDPPEGLRFSIPGGSGSEKVPEPPSPLPADLVSVARSDFSVNCPDCGNPWELVPPSAFWYACRVCYPATFREES